ncbi:PolC-type DNA polymerase III [Mycoplasmopsis cricetuli]|uniref:PolC-type DNA polymerase III n=1 Tax=Mycoplasmopsis cricetuli TaxID=171283 RepID=UPI000471C939|nr:PolC-type DNA polymerase III [Mycoplasmopsis cricetuli]
MSLKKFYSDISFHNFVTNINLENLDSIKDAYFFENEVLYDEKNNSFSFTICFKTLPIISDFVKLNNKLIEYKPIKINVSYHIDSYYPEDNLIKEYICYFLLHNSNYFLKGEFYKQGKTLYNNIDNRKWTFSYTNKDEFEFLQSMIEFLQNQFKILGLTKIEFDLDFHSIENIPEKDISNFDFSFNEFNNFEDKFKASVSEAKYNKYKTSKNFQKISISEINSLDEIPEKFAISCDGVIFKTDFINRKQFFIYKYWISDFKDAIEISFFSKNKLSGSDIFDIDDYVQISGIVENKFKSTQKIIKADKIEKINSPNDLREDLAPKKRIELNAKSQMNTMDGLMSAQQLVKMASDFGHKAVALLDSDGIQEFHNFSSAAKKANIKPIYGSSFSVIEQNNKIFLNEFDNLILDDIEYVAFDLETTNLSPMIADIIEFGAVVIKNKKIIEKHQFFLKAHKPLSQFTKELTSITDEMLQNDGINQQEGIEKIYQILKGRVAIAHNADFDMSHIFEKFQKYNLPALQCTFIDTLAVSRLIFDERSKHSLGDTAFYLSVEYNEIAAHRADYDAEVLGKIWIQFLNKFKNLNIFTTIDLSKIITENFYNKKRSDFQISVLAKNQKGINELFKLVSLTLTERVFKTPKLFYEDLPKSPNLLVGSGGIRSPLLYSYMYRSKYSQQKLMDLFDYIEIPQPKSLLNLVGENDFSLNDIYEILKKIIYDALKKNKKVVAVSDARYANQEDQAFYKILVYSKGVGNTSHFLFDRRKIKNNTFKLPDLHFLTTDEMLKEFAFLKDTQLIEDIVINNPLEIFNLIEDNIEIVKKDLYTPKFDNSSRKLYDLVYKNAHNKYGDVLPELIKNRIESELNPIINHGFDVIYWISHILVKKSIDSGYIVGSRGSIGSSLVANLANISEVNPLPPHYNCSKCKYFELNQDNEITSGFDLDDKACPKCQNIMLKDGHNIPFETFLGFNADKVPDIDLNFSGEFQLEIHNEVKRIFGEKNIFRAGTILKIKDKTAYAFVKKVDEEYNFGYSPAFLTFLANKVVGVKRTTGKHAGGIIIIPEEFEVEYFTPVNYPAGDNTIDWKTTHFDYKFLHDNILKLDILGHVNPTAVRMLERLTNVNAWKDIPRKDKRVMSLFSSTKELKIKPEQIGGEQTGALGIPEFGTNFVRKMLAEAQPQTFADLISLCGLSHGEDVWANNAQTLIKNNGLKIKDVISCRDDMLIYLVDKKIDPLYAFKIMEKVRKGQGITSEEEEFLLKNKIPSWYIESMKKIKYMFPKAHAAAYVIMAWIIAWFKLYYPIEYYATFLSTRVSEFELETLINDFGGEKINKKIKEIQLLNDKKAKDKELLITLEITREMYARGISISNIDLKKSHEIEWIIDYKNNSLIPPFTAIKGLGEAVAKKIIQARNERPFRSKEDFLRRSSVNKTLFNTFNELKILDELNETDQMTLF